MITTETFVSRSITVNAPIERAFAVFTEGFDTWWPRSHHIADVEMAEAIIEPRAGGRWYEIDVDGSECDWGKVLVWEPPRRVVFGWQLNHQWEYDPNLVTEVEVSFTPVGNAQTRVILEHRNMERFGEAAAAMHQALSSDQGWVTHLTLFAKAAAQEPAHA